MKKLICVLLALLSLPCSLAGCSSKNESNSSSLAENTDSEQSDESDISSRFYDSYEKDGLSFDIPDGWFVEDSGGHPDFFVDNDDGSTDELIEIFPTEVFFGKGEVTEETIISYYEAEIEDGYCSDYLLTEKGTLEAAAFSASYYDVTASYTNTSYGSDRTRYIVTDKDYLIILISLDTDTSFSYVEGSFQSFSDTIVFPSDK